VTFATFEIKNHLRNFLGEMAVQRTRTLIPDDAKVVGSWEAPCKIDFVAMISSNPCLVEVSSG
jgi:hypothetical protein